MDIKDVPKRIIKSELAKKNLHVRDLVERLNKDGEELTEYSFNNKMSRGAFNAVFFFKCLKVLETKNIRLEDYFF
ncbi:MAG: hypothetical protein H6Q35_1361 [Proteobacteria bacterium]|nr:hypothetical protein [Pseudomonadota bacterium]